MKPLHALLPHRDTGSRPLGQWVSVRDLAVDRTGPVWTLAALRQGYVVSREPHLGQFVLRVELHRSCGFEADGELSQQGAIVRLLVITALAVLSGSGVALLGDDRALLPELHTNSSGQP